MIPNTVLSNLELAIVSMLGSFLVTMLILLTIAIFFYYRKQFYGVPTNSISGSQKEESLLIRKATILSSVKTVFHFKNDAYIIHENEDSTVSYTISFRTASEKLALKINDLIIGGKTKSIKPHMPEINELFLRIQLNNNSTNSMVNSEIYNFTSKIIIDEMFLFSLKEYQLKSTTVGIDVFVSLTTKTEDLLLGFVEIMLPGDATEYPVTNSAILKEVHRPVDLYQIPIGYMCLSLANIYRNIKITILASIHYNRDIETEYKTDYVICYNLEMKNSKDEAFGHTCKTTTKCPSATVVWNEVFVFDVLENFKQNSLIKIELWKSVAKVSIKDSPPELLGTINLGLSEYYPEKGQLHWKYIMDNENVESFRWHAIRKDL